MRVSMNDGMDYEFCGPIDEELVRETWSAIAGGASEESIADLCDKWPCLAIVGSHAEAKEWLNELDRCGLVSGCEENLEWTVTGS